MAYGWQRPRNPTKQKQILSACVWSASSNWMMTNEGGLTGNAWREDVEKQGCAEVVGTTCRCPLGTCDLRLRPSPCYAKLYKKGIIQPSPICTHVPAKAEKEGTVAKAEEFGSVGKVVL
uniref:Uncharacterized protein n=1 Tax=Oryza barthii TaxID=65489 RepID=A0A0D3FM95_9ORYZ